MSNGQAIRNFILDYIERQGSTDATDEQFHQEFFQRFGGARRETFYGAQMVYKAQRWLAKMHQEKLLDRRVFPISDAPAEGYPKWVWGYTIND